MAERTESELLGQIELLESRSQELMIQNESLSAGFDERRLEIHSPPGKRSPSSHRGNFISAATFPLVAGFFRLIYKRIYRLKK
jgi:hypothetical protein